MAYVTKLVLSLEKADTQVALYGGLCGTKLPLITGSMKVQRGHH